MAKLSNEEHYTRYKEHYLKKNKSYYTKNREQLLLQKKEYFQKNKERIRATRKQKYTNDLNTRVLQNLRCRIRHAFKQGFSKSISTLELVGCSIDALKTYLETTFSKGMSWEDYGTGKLHIDHIVPCSVFDLSDIEEQKKCFHYTNLQMLWAIDNLKKSNKNGDK